MSCRKPQKYRALKDRVPETPRMKSGAVNSTKFTDDNKKKTDAKIEREKKETTQFSSEWREIVLVQSYNNIHFGARQKYTPFSIHSMQKSNAAELSVMC